VISHFFLHKSVGYFFLPYFNLIKESFPDAENHRFFLLTGSGFLERDDIERLDLKLSLRNFRLFRNQIYKSENVIIHGLFDNRLALFLFILFSFFRKEIPKITWVIWGADLYRSQFPYSLKRKFGEWFRKKALSKIQKVACLVPGDFDLAKKKFNSDSVFFQSFYPNAFDFSFLNQIKKSENPNKEPKVLLGNSASRTNNHFEGIDFLSQIQGIDFEIVCPLSYGDKAYARQVEEYGKNRLGNRFIPLMDLLEPKEYAKVLASVDSAFMFHRRQQALGNIISLLYLGKKVFLFPEVTTYSWMTKDLGISMFPIPEAFPGNPRSIFEMDPEAGEKNQRIISEFFSPENVKNLWAKVFSS